MEFCTGTGFSSVDIVCESLLRYFGKHHTAPGATLPIEADAPHFPHIESIAIELWRANGDDNRKFDAHFEVEGSKMPTRKRLASKWTIAYSNTATDRYNLNKAEIRAIIGQPFDMWNGRGAYGDDRIESLLGDIDLFRGEYKRKLLIEKNRKAEQHKTMYLEKTRLSGVDRASQPRPTFATPSLGNATPIRPGPSRTVAPHQPSAKEHRQNPASVPSPLSATPVGRFPSSVHADHDYAEPANVNAEVLRLRRELEEKTDQLELCEREKRELQADTRRMADDLGTMREKAGEADQLKADNDRLKKESQDALDKLQEKTDEAVRLKADNERLAKEAQEANEKLQQALDKLAHKSAEVESLNEQLHLRQQELDAVKSVKEALHEAKAQLEATNAEMRREMDQAKYDIETVEQENRFHEDENARLVLQIRAHQREAAKLKDEMARLQREKDDLAQKAFGSGPQVASTLNAGAKRSSSVAAPVEINDGNHPPSVPSHPKRSRGGVRSQRSIEDYLRDLAEYADA